MHRCFQLESNPCTSILSVDSNLLITIRQVTTKTATLHAVLEGYPLALMPFLGHVLSLDLLQPNELWICGHMALRLISQAFNI